MKALANISLFILILLIIPEDGILGNHRYETCKDDDKQQWNRILWVAHKDHYYICKIGYIDGIVNLGWTLDLHYDSYTNIEDVENSILSVTLLNTANVNSFIKGDRYGVSNFKLASDVFTLWDIGSSFSSHNVEDVNLEGDNYYLVINFGHRSTFEKEDVESKPAYYDIFKGWLSNMRDEDNTYITSTVDVDYTENDVQATS